MTPPRIYKGTWAELNAHTGEFKDVPELILVVPAPHLSEATRYRSDLTPNERIRRLDALAERNAHIPALPVSAFEREALYCEDV